MRQMRAWLLRLGDLFGRTRREREFAAEMESHLQMHIEDNLRTGMNAEEARRQALMKLGGVEQIKENYREQRGLPILEILLRDLRFGARMLAKNAGFTLIAVFTLALGIGATTAIFSVVYGVLLRPLPYAKPDQIFQLWEVNAKGKRVNFTEPNFSDMRSTSRSLEGLVECNVGPFTITGGSEPTRTLAAVVSRDFFKVMGVSPLFGRGFNAEDQREGAAPVLLVSHSYWQQYLGGSTDLSKLKLAADHKVFSIVGVMPQGFRFPYNADFWVPREIYPPNNESRTAHNWHVFGRVRDGASLAQAARRERELAIRAALGADRRRLVWQFLMEAALLCGMGGMIGVFAARWGVDALVELAPKELPRLDSG